MPININSINFSNEFNLATTDYLQSNTLDAITVVIDNDTYWKSDAEVDNVFTFATKSIAREFGDWSSDGFNVGDNITVQGGSLSDNNKIETTIEKFSTDGLTLYIVGSFGTAESVANCSVYGYTQIEATDYYYNLVENQEANNYIGKVDPAETWFRVDGLDAWSPVVKNMIPQGFSSAWVHGTYTIQGNTYVFEASGVNTLNITSGSATISKTAGNWDDINVGDIIQISGANAANNGAYEVQVVSGLSIGLDRNMGATESSTVAELKIISYQRFKITHEFWTNPFFLNDQLDALTDGIPAPTYFYGDKCLKYIYKIITKLAATDPNKVFIYEIDPGEQLGNSGWFDENYNGGVPVYSLESITYQDNATAVSVDSIQYCRKTDIEIIIEASSDIFQSGYFSPEFVLHHFYCPLNTEWYQQNSNLFRVNFIYDRAFQTAGASAVNGDYSFLSNITGTVLSATRLKINASIDLTLLSINALDVDDRNYCIALSIQDRDDADNNNDRVTVKCDVNEYSCDLDNSDIWSVYNDVLFYEHPYYQIEAKTDIKAWLEDSILSNTTFWYDIGSASNPNKITGLYIAIEAEKTATGETYEMERYDLSTLFKNAVVQNGVQQLSLDTTRGFKLISGNNKNWIKVDRRTDLDTVGGATRYYYQIYYALKIRWEDWIKDVNVPDDFYDITLRQAGFNRDWQEKYAKAGWEIKFRIYADVEEQATEVHTTSFKHSCDVNILDYDDDNDNGDSWTGEIETFDLSDNNLNEKIQTYANTKVKATFTKQVNGVYPTNPYGILEIEEYQKGGILNIGQISSIYQTEPDTPWVSQNSPDDRKATVTGNGIDEIYVDATIDFTKIDKSKQYKLSARMGDYWPPEATEGKMWVVGQSGSIYYSPDRGITWVDQSTGAAFHYDNSMVDENIGYTSGTGGTILKTIDGGDNWNSQTSGTAQALINIIAFNDSDAVAASFGSDEFLYTTDGGSNWNIVTTTVITTGFNKISFIDKNIGYGFGKNGKIAKTIDGGLNWVEVYDFTGLNPRGTFASEQIGYVLTNPSGNVVNIHKTIDGGITWTLQQIYTFGANPAWVYVDASDIDHAVAIIGNGARNTIFRTTNGGATWTKLIETSVLYSNMRWVTYKSNLEYYIAFQGKVLKTLNGGVAFTEIDPPSSNFFFRANII